MLETLKQWDTDIFLALNGIHSNFWDFIMYWTSEKLTWAPVYGFIIYLLIRHFKKEAFLIIPVALIMIVFYSSFGFEPGHEGQDNPKDNNSGFAIL